MKDLQYSSQGIRQKVKMMCFAAICAICLMLTRNFENTVIMAFGIPFAFTDIFVMIPAGIGGMGCGLLTFSFVFITELFRQSVNYASMYSVSIYLLLVLMTSHLSCRKWYQGRKCLFYILMISAALALCWRIVFTSLLPNQQANNVFYGVGLHRLFLAALPETIISAAAIALFWKWAPEKIKKDFGGGWIYARGRNASGPQKQILGTRISAISMMEAFLLCVIAILCDDIFSSVEAGSPFTFAFAIGRWRDSLRMGLMMMSASVPIAYLFNTFIMVQVVSPINDMSMLMDRYFQMDEKERQRELPDLHIHTGDEIEKLYHSLKKMVGDMGTYIDLELEQERKSAHLTHGFMLALAKAVDAKDRYTSGHSTRVAQYSREIARRMGKNEQEQENIYMMGLLHDIGKIGVPESIINKTGKLTDEEFAKIKEHPVMGSDILKNVSELPGLAIGARWHHERYDGRGYPDGLKGNQIPEEARIIAVADAYDAMTSNRAYSSIRPQETVRAEIVRCSGTQFDPQIADVFLTMIDDDRDYKMHE